jgi:hypothetical protein
MPKPSRDGTAERRKSVTFHGKNGAKASLKRRRLLRGIISPDRRTAVLRKRKGCLVTSLAIDRSTQFGNPCSRRISRVSANGLACLFPRRGETALFAVHQDQYKECDAVQASMDFRSVCSDCEQHALRKGAIVGQDGRRCAVHADDISPEGWMYVYSTP